MTCPRCGRSVRNLGLRKACAAGCGWESWSRAEDPVTPAEVEAMCLMLALGRVPVSAGADPAGTRHAADLVLALADRIKAERSNGKIGWYPE